MSQPRVLRHIDARRVAQRRAPDPLVIGADQLAVIGDKVLGKPGDHAKAIEQLLAEGKHGRANPRVVGVPRRGSEPGFEAGRRS